MALADIQPETRVIPVGGSSFAVKGLSLTDVTTLVRTHLTDAEALFDLGSNVLAGKADINESDVTKIAVALSEQAPGFVANLIALAAGEPNAVDNAYKLPAPVQIKALITIAELTFSEVGGIKKAWEAVASLLKDKAQARIQASPL